MSQPPPDLSHMSPVEKRVLLAKLLQQKASAVSAPSSVDQQRLSVLDRFAVPVTDLNAEVVLDPDFRAESLSAEYITEPGHVFLTGATGFLGAFLLHELLRQT